MVIKCWLINMAILNGPPKKMIWDWHWRTHTQNISGTVGYSEIANEC